MIIKRKNNIECFYCKNHLHRPYRDKGDGKDYCALTGDWILSSGGSCEHFKKKVMWND